MRYNNLSEQQLSPFSALSINTMLAADAQMEGETPLSHMLPDVRSSAYGVMIGRTSPGSNIGFQSHDRVITPIMGENFIGFQYPRDVVG